MKKCKSAVLQAKLFGTEELWLGGTVGDVRPNGFARLWMTSFGRAQAGDSRETVKICDREKFLLFFDYAETRSSDIFCTGVAEVNQPVDG
jgi:hypothetical protein